ncbi:RAI1 like PD-XK nuclease-domain-containing protein [Triangularia verruculosa]|uniref:Decapping nuclease n=1 Tax=Triangularia verruculosa TaxID=2587418 RepID=A0AAN6XP88_9PEZI|nr:RAI1 like PD-XK nuclease-domain-containing protein [Triangularia verruculosa]
MEPNPDISRLHLDLNRLEAATTQVSIKRPREFTCFSYDKNHNLHLDDSSLKWYYPPQAHEFPANLSAGYEQFEKHDSSQDEHLDSLLTAITHHEQQTNQLIDAKFVTWRGMMTKFFCAPYSNDDFEMNATLFQDCIFIEENWAFKRSQEAEDKKNWKSPLAPELMQFWGYKFETLATIPRPWGETPRETIESRDSEIVNNKEQYCSIVRTAIGGKVMCLGGEVDAIWDSKPKTPGAPINWVELKTSKVNRTHKDSFAFNRKLLRYWAQSFLLGVPKIIVGFRDHEGLLQSIEEYKTREIEEAVRREWKNSTNWNWRPWVCINFTSELLDWAQQIIKADPQQSGVWRIRFRKQTNNVELFKVEETGHGRILTEEFVKWRTLRAQSLNPDANPKNQDVDDIMG